VAQVEVLSMRSPGGTEENYKNALKIAGLRAEIRNRDLRNVKHSVTILFRLV
jgi:hypothetical protein